MIKAGQDVFDAELEIHSCHGPTGLRSGDLDPGLRWMDDDGPASSVEHLDADQHVGDSQLQSGKLDALTGESIGTGVNPPSLHEGVRQFLYVGLSQILHVVGELEHDWQAHSRQYRRPP